ncbi:hydrogenase formation protein HypD [Ectothiorhodospira mobilis]|uniref:hydrogenase formation protein HypD n=1 Tax=Ectothiorhodospira mobilis TaxID=195064 RepID=UPI001EE930CA|nr:hydrogenase formation protein HypD [Ectothiorhodospira mobilis]
MSATDPYRDPGMVRALAAAIAREAQPGRVYRLMEFCGGHTHAIARHGLTDLLPPGVRLVHGPGCPACVLPPQRVDQAIALTRIPGLILCAYGDTLRLPGVRGDSLHKARARGGDVRPVYAAPEAVACARRHPDRAVVFFAIGFETTAPATAVALLQAREAGLENFSVYCNHVLTPPAMAAVLAGDAAVDGVIGPGHVAAITGPGAFTPVARDLGRPVVVCGFEPVDLLQGILQLLRQLHAGRREVENAYARVVAAHGNPRARALMDRVFCLRPRSTWRGLGELPASALGIAPAFRDLDAEQRHPIPETPPAPDPGVGACECGAILRGRKAPRDCRLFGRACTPDTPLGACMVSPEGACAAAFVYGGRRPRGR